MFLAVSALVNGLLQTHKIHVPDNEEKEFNAFRWFQKQYPDRNISELKIL